jgi:16S rRNA C967 or C1407 C5-methylase (RsmB/RsmF family)
LDEETFGFYALPDEFRLQQSACFREGRIYGQDVSSGAAVAALMTDRHDAKAAPKQFEGKAKQEGEGGVPGGVPAPLRVLDLCCSPGLKLCAIADWLRSQRQTQQSSSQEPDAVVGVDVSEDRMAVCKRIVNKYQIGTIFALERQDSKKTTHNSPSSDGDVRIRLYCNDGTTFGMQTDELNLVFDSQVALEDDAARLGKRKRMNKSAKARERKRLKQLSTCDFSLSGESTEDGSEAAATTDTGCGLQLFDRVLVDAECSTDGSLRHIQKRLLKVEKNGESVTDESLTLPRLTDHQQLTKLVALQRQLAASGFRLLKPGGYMVYSTCSLSDDQNEGVVRWLLERHSSNARIVPVSFNGGNTNLVREGTISGTVRFFPNIVSKTPDEEPSSSSGEPVALDRLYGGGFFLAKIQKI